MHGWMLPDAVFDEHELASLYEQTTAELPPRCRQVHSMVREEGCSYARVGETLRISRSAVCRHVVNAQHRFRDELEAHGYVACARPRAPRSERDAKRRRKARTATKTECPKRGGR
jgi:hypothetical protein